MATRATLPLFLTLLVACGRATTPQLPLEPDSNRVYSVCELFKDLGAFAGKRVTVRGIYYAGLRDKGCPGEIVAGGRSWPKALWLVETGRFLEADSLEGSDSYERGWRKLHSEHLRLGQSRQRAEIWVTVTGRLHGPKAHWVPNSGMVGGFGHLGVFPGEILVERVADIDVLPTPTYDYGFPPKPDL